MPYRVKKGQIVKIDYENADGQSRMSKEVPLRRTVDFTKAELVRSPLDEHHKEGIRESLNPLYPWAFNIKGKWENDTGVPGLTLSILYVKEVHVIPSLNAPDDFKTVNVQGSGTNTYTLTLNDHGAAVHCTCPGFRFKRVSCKHTNAYNESQGYDQRKGKP